MIKKSLISLMYEAASIQRWNDHIRPWTGFTAVSYTHLYLDDLIYIVFIRNKIKVVS